MWRICVLFAAAALLDTIGASQTFVKNVEELVHSNPLLAEMPMFQPPVVQVLKASSKRSSERERVDDNFGEKYQHVNRTYFALAHVEPTEIAYREFRGDDDVALEEAIGEESATTTTMMTPFAANESVFEEETSPQVERFFEEEEGERNSVEEEETQEEDISANTGLSRATFRGSSFVELLPLQEEGEGERKSDENEVVQYNGRYTVSATKYYVDNRIDGEHYEHVADDDNDDPRSFRREREDREEDIQEEEDVDQINVDPFAVEKEMRKVARMHGTKIFEANGDDGDDDVAPIHVAVVAAASTPASRVRMEKDDRGRDVETRETTYLGTKSTVRLWNRVLHGHDYLQNPGAVFDDVAMTTAKMGKQKARGTKLLEAPRKGSKSIASLATARNSDKSRITQDLSSICFNSRENTAISGEMPVESIENVTKMQCLLKCAKSATCHIATYSTSLGNCAFYGDSVEQLAEISSQGHSLHRKIGTRGKTTWRCARMFVSTQFVENVGENSVLESSPAYLRLVEKDSKNNALFRSRSVCPSNYESIFVRSDGVEATIRGEPAGVEISEDDCVFACLTNTRPGGGEPQPCIAIEYDQRRGICNLLSSFPDDVAMTPQPVNPVNVYEKICVQKTSSNRCSGGQPIRFRQMVLIGHLVDAHSSPTAEQCIDLCIEKRSIGCVSVMYYSKETTLNCILNDSTHLQDATSFFKESSPEVVVDYFSIDECLGIREVERRRLHPRSRTKYLERMRRQMRKL